MQPSTPRPPAATTSATTPTRPASRWLSSSTGSSTSWRCAGRSNGWRRRSSRTANRQAERGTISPADLGRLRLAAQIATIERQQTEQRIIDQRRRIAETPACRGFPAERPEQAPPPREVPTSTEIAPPPREVPTSTETAPPTGSVPTTPSAGPTTTVPVPTTAP
jgi:hypothetical protein